MLLNDDKGIAALPTILLVGGIILEISMALAFVSFYLVQSTSGVKIASYAMAAAQAGIDDAVIKTVRNSYTLPYSYALPLSGNRTAQVNVTDLGSGKREITSSGSAGSRNKKLKAVLGVDSVTREVRVESVEEIPL